MEIVKQYLEAVKNWLKVNKLQLNPDQIEMLHFFKCFLS